MKIRFLGTAAYEGIPSLFCNCAVCSGARKAGGRNLRSRSQAIVNGELLLDFPADTLWHAQRFGLDWNAIGSCLITHPHSDHFYPEDMVMGRPDFCHDNRPMNYYLPAAAELRLRQEIALTGLSDMQGRIVPHRVEPFYMRTIRVIFLKTRGRLCVRSGSSDLSPWTAREERTRTGGKITCA